VPKKTERTFSSISLSKRAGTKTHGENPEIRRRSRRRAPTMGHQKQLSSRNDSGSVAPIMVNGGSQVVDFEERSVAATKRNHSRR
jgi:hypothetical protein